MENPIRRQIWLMRGIGEKKSLMFSLSLAIEQEGEYFAASISGMDDQMAATGRTTEEALHSARLLFMMTVEDALAEHRSISYATGQEPITLDLPLSEAPKFFHLLTRELMKRETEIPDWLAISTSDSTQLERAE